MIVLVVLGVLLLGALVVFVRSLVRGLHDVDNGIKRAGEASGPASSDPTARHAWMRGGDGGWGI